MLPVPAPMSSKLVLVAVALTLWASPALAEDTAWDRHPVAVYAVGSVPGGPAGMLGAELELSPFSRLGATLGVGIGLNSDIDGWRALPRYAVAIGCRAWQAQRDDDGGAAGFWLSGSTGHYYDAEFTIESGVADKMYEIPRAFWIGVAFVGERRYQSGLSLKGAVGLEFLANSADARCYAREHGSSTLDRISCDDVNRFTLSPIFPAVSVSLGYAF